jgi:hypothetical protein
MKELKMNKRSWRMQNLWKPTIVCAALFLMIVGNAQAAVNVNLIESQPVELSAKAVKLQSASECRWISSGQELFYTTTTDGYTRFVGIRAIMRIPGVIETGWYYSIPVYFTRFYPQLSVSSEQVSIVPSIEKDMVDADGTVKKQLVVPIDVLMCTGIGAHSNYRTNLPGDCLYLGVGVCDGDMWTHELPIVIKNTARREDSAQYAVTGFEQKLWIQQPSYRYLTDIPIRTWDGPYFIRVRIDPLFSLPPNDVELSEDHIPPPIPPADLSADATVVSLPKESVQIATSTLVSLNEYEPVLFASLEKSAIKSIESIDVKEVNNEPVYQIKGVREAKLLWVIPVDMEITMNIDITTGAVKTVETPWWGFLTS